MSLLAKNGDKHKSTESPASGSSPLFRKSTSFDSPGLEGERPPSQQSGRSGGGGNRKKIIPAFFSNLFGGGNKVPENEAKPSPPPTPTTPVISKAPGASLAPGESSKKGGKKSSSHESINSVQSSSSFSFVNPSKMGGKRVKGKRIPVDDPHYGSTTTANNGSKGGSENHPKKSFGSTLDKIGIKMGLKKKYNLQSCESLQYIDACDEPLPIVAGTKLAEIEAAPSASGSSQIQSASTSQGQPSSSSSQIESKVIEESPRAEGKDEPMEIVSSVNVNAEFSSKCLARTKHINNVQPTKLANLGGTESTSCAKADEQMKPAATSDVKSTKKTVSESFVQTVPPVREQIPPTPPGHVVVVPEPKPVPVPLTVTAQTKEEVEPFSPKTEVKAKIETKESKETNVMPSIPKTEVKAAKIDTKESKECDMNPFSFDETEASAEVETKESEIKCEVLTTPKSSTPPASTDLTESPKNVPTLDEEKPCSPRSITSRLSPPPQEPSTSASAPRRNAPLAPFVNSNTWSNSNRRKRRAPQPPSLDISSPQKFTNGTSHLVSDTFSSGIPNDVPSPSSRAAILTKFKRIEESPPPNSGGNINLFEIRPRKKEKSLEPPPVTRPALYAGPSCSSGTGTLFNRHQHRYQEHKRSCSEGYSTNSQGRVHKPGKKKAPPPPNPFGDPDEPGESTGNEDVPMSDLPSEPSYPPPDQDVDPPRRGNSAVTTNEPPSIPKSSEWPPPLPATSSNSKTIISTTTTSTCSASEQRQVSPVTSVTSAGPSLTYVSVTVSSANKSSPAPTVSECPPIPPVTTTSSPTPPSSTSAISTQPTVALTSTITFTSTAVTPTFIRPLPVVDTANTEPPPEVLDEIRQNMLNDEQERQQLGLLLQTNEASSSSQVTSLSLSEPEPSTEIIITPPSRPTSQVPTIASSSTSASASMISETDIQSAQQTLATLTASIQSSTVQPKKEPAVADPTVKAKLVELKKEADKSPLNSSRSKSRPSSIGSAIYESPLALLFGRSSNSNSSTATSSSNNEASGRNEGTAGTSSAESSPKIASKPWYKRGGPTALKDFMSSKSKHTTPIKPFTSLVKFSELDKEATRIVEENRRRSAEQQRQSESDQDELDEMFSSTIAAGAIDSGSPRSHSTAPTRVFTTAQVHPAITEETDTSTGEALAEPVQPSSSSPEAPASPSTNNKGSSSPPSFQSVHAASKHRQIKPLLSSSPITNVRSEKLAIVQPQANTNSSRNGSDTRPPSSTAPFPSIWASLAAAASTTTSLAPTTVTSSTATKPATTTVTSSNHNSQEWDCPRCTLKNPSWRILCEICFQRKDSAPCGSYISSLLQRVNSEGNSNRLASVTVVNSSSSPVTPTATTVAVTSSSLPVSSNSSKVVPPPPPIHSSSSSSHSSSSGTGTATSVITTSPKSATATTNSVTACSPTHCIPSVVEQFTPTSVSPGGSSSRHHHNAPDNDTSQSHSHKTAPKTVSSTNVDKKPDIPLPAPPPPSCENFLSQLPAKQDLAKEEKLQGMKLHEDPELEELDISKLREARLAYFRRRESGEYSSTASATPTPPPRSSDESVKSPAASTQLNDSNDLDSKLSPSHPKSQDKPHSSDNNAKGNSSSQHPGSKNTAQVSTPSASNASSSREDKEHNMGETPEEDHDHEHDHLQTFSDNEDDFIDDMLQLDNNEIPTTIANITGLLPCPSSSTAANSSSPSPSPTLLQNRYRPKLEAIREGSSQDYTYCYSPREIAQIYENWQASQQHQQNGGFLSNRAPALMGSPIPSGIISLQETHLLDQHQLQPSIFTGNLVPAHGNDNMNPLSLRRTHPIPIARLDHQPYANNRLADSPEENYVNMDTLTPPTLINDGGNNLGCATSAPMVPPLCLSSTFAGGHQQQHGSSGGISSSVIDGNSIAANINQIQNSLSDNRNNYENNNMNMNPGGSSSARLAYEDYRRMGAIPKGYPFNSRQNDEWSSESSCDTDSSRGLWGRGGGGGGGGSGYQDSLPGSTRRGTLEFSQPLDMTGFPDPTFAVGKLMKRLEAAIACGDHRLAATLAHDLALMKVSCVVSKINQPYSIRVYVEDRFMQQGPFLIQVSSMMTVRDLKAKVESDWGIPSGFQKWILGKKMAEDDNLSLSSFEMAPDAMVFLFLVTPDMGNARPGMIPMDGNGKPSNQSKCLPTVSDLTTSTSFAAATAGLNRNLVGGSDTRKSISPARNMPSVPTGHTYDVIPEDGIMQHLYNNLDNAIKPTNQSSPKTKRNDEGKPNVPSSSKKTSAVQKATSSLVKELTPPPPLPCRSPIPGGPLSNSRKSRSDSQQKNSGDAAVKPTEEKITNTVPNRPVKSAVNSKQAPKKEQHAEGQQRQSRTTTAVHGESLSAASTITLSLQQKLAEFKNIAEQAFAKSGVRSRQSSKERSPAPVPSTSKNPPNTPDPSAKKNESGTSQTKLVAKKVVRPARSSSKERMVTSAPGSIEKLTVSKDEKRQSRRETVAPPTKPTSPENRFNGILLPSSDNTENLKPPERLDKTKNNASRVASPEKVSEDEGGNNRQKRDSGIHSKPPLPPQVNVSADKSPSPAPAPAPSPSIGKTEKCEFPKTEHLEEEASVSPAPQPMPRILRKQQSAPESQPIVQENEATTAKPVEENVSQYAPIPVPRTSSAAAKAERQLSPAPEVRETNIVTPSPQVEQSQPKSATVLEASSPINQEAQAQVTVDDFCQTTLPFPAPRNNARGINESGGDIREPSAFTNRQSQAMSTSIGPGQHGPSAPTNIGLLRPSAFVSQFRPDANNSSQSPVTTGSSILLPILTANFTNAPTSASENSSLRTTTTSHHAIAVAHVQPLNVTPPKQSSTPTAYVAPSPSTSQQQNMSNVFPGGGGGGALGNKKDDSPQSYLKLLELMEAQDLVTTMDDAECPVCFASVPKGEGIVLRDCLHTFCRECLIGCVQYADDSTVKCPYRDNDYACNYTLQEREIKALVPSEIFEKYLARSLKLAEHQTLNTYHCKTTDCTGWCVFEDDVNSFFCPVCKIRNCLTCAAIHDGIDCQEYQRQLAIAAETDEDAKQSRLMLEKMIQRGEALDCPACHVVLLKKWGCDWVRCSYCKTEICWVTKGFRWGKEGKGDITGGCKCGVNGVKCHPKCTYCH